MCNVPDPSVVMCRVVASVSTPRSRGRLEASRRLASVSGFDASVSPRSRASTPRSRLGLVVLCKTNNTILYTKQNKNLARAETRPTRRTLRAQVPACTLWPVCRTKFIAPVSSQFGTVATPFEHIFLHFC